MRRIRADDKPVLKVSGPPSRRDCKKCLGKGRLAMFPHVDNGRCWRCNGSGNDPDTNEK